MLAPDNLLGLVPSGWEKRLPELVTVPNNFVTAWHTLEVDLHVPLPWPKPQGYKPEQPDKAFLVWGGSSSSGQYTLQVLRYYGYHNVVATASPRNFDLVKENGATHVVNYNSKSWKEEVQKAVGKVDLVLDCIGSLEASIKPIASLVQGSAKVAVLLPVIVRDSTDEIEPIYTWDVAGSAKWAEGVEAVGVRTHFYLEVCSLLQNNDIQVNFFPGHN